MLPIDELESDILILGTGGAGMMAALHAHTANPKLKITMIVKGLLGQSGCTRMVQGGYNCVLNPNDSFERHFEDTIKGGQFINNQDLAWALVSDSPDRIIELENRCGCLFDRNADGTIHQKPFAGQSFDRTVHKGDLTGIEIMSNLRDYIICQENVTVLQETRGLDLLAVDGRVVGAVLLDNRKGRFVVVRAKATLVCTGGGATMFEISSPSLEKAGDGQAMAFRAGAEFIDMEMMQFHPTGLLVGKSIATGGLLEEGLRGAGAHLFNAAGERYMQRYAPDKAERATRDIVSRSSYMEIMAGRGTPSGGVLIDVTHLGAEFVMKNFKGMVERCREYGFDLVNSRVEVSPSAHFHMGGITIDLNCMSSMPGLFAAGEDAGGVHGANRLGGNGVADSIVFGARAGDAMSQYVLSQQMPIVSKEQVKQLAEKWLAPLNQTSGDNPFEVREKLERVMWRKVGVVRNGDDMRAAVPEIQDVKHRSLSCAGSGSTIYNAKWNEVINTHNLATIGETIARSALHREESRGAHYRTDFPKQDVKWLKNVRMQGTAGGEMKIWTTEVKFTKLTPPELKEKQAIGV